MKLSIAQIQDVMRQAGWPDHLITTGSAVAYYESDHGDTHAGKVDSVESSYGLFQINLGRPGTQLARERAALGPPERLYDPVYNAQVAYDIFQQQGWNAWRTTYYLHPERYQQYLPEAERAYSGQWVAETPTTDYGGDDYLGLPDLSDYDFSAYNSSGGAPAVQSGLGPIAIVAVALIGFVVAREIGII